MTDSQFLVLIAMISGWGFLNLILLSRLIDKWGRRLEERRDINPGGFIEAPADLKITGSSSPGGYRRLR